MRRREAAQLFSEICECIPDASITSISLTPSNRSKEEFDLRINMSLDAESLTNLQSLVSNHGMILKEDKGYLLIHGSQIKPTGIEITA